MEIVTVQNIWKSYNATDIPLSVSVMSDRSVQDRREIKVFFNGKTTLDGEVRVLCTIIKRKEEKAPAVIIAGDSDGSDEHIIDDLYSEGYNVIIPDYYGKSEKEKLYSLFPESLAHCTSIANYSRLYENIKQSPWITAAEIIMRTVTFVSGLEYVDPGKIFVVGIGMGSSLAIMACGLDKRISAGVSLYSSGFFPDGTDETSLCFRASVTPDVYAPNIECPFLMMISSNEYNNTFDDMLGVYEKIGSEKSYLSISERTAHSVGRRQKDNIKLFLNDCRDGKADGIPQAPELLLREDGKKLMYEISTDGLPELFVSYEKENSRMANWHSEKINTKGNCSGHIDIFRNDRALLAFVNASFPRGYSFSSKVVRIDLEKAGIEGSRLPVKRLVYDSDMGTDDWLSIVPGSPYNTIQMCKGPYNIPGVKSVNGKLSTFKLGEEQYQGEDGHELQITLYSPEKISAKIILVTYEDSEYVAYAANTDIDPDIGWNKISLGVMDFKTNRNSMLSWKNLELLTIDSSSAEVIVSSVLWV